jgi:hypothetical protein
MKIVKLDSSNILGVRRLFEKKKYMGSMVHSNYFVATDQDYVEYYHTAFSDTYLSDLNNYHAYGAIDDGGIVQGLIGFYESTDDASWYGTHIKNSGDKKVAQLLLDTAIKHNEERGRLKFYTLWSAKHAKLLRRFTFSEWANERYDYFDEYMIPLKHQCKYNLHWQILYNRTLIPIDTVVRCTFLKNAYRTNWSNAGRL